MSSSDKPSMKSFKAPQPYQDDDQGESNHGRTRRARTNNEEPGSSTIPDSSSTAAMAKADVDETRSSVPDSLAEAKSAKTDVDETRSGEPDSLAAKANVYETSNKDDNFRDDHHPSRNLGAPTSSAATVVTENVGNNRSAPRRQSRPVVPGAVRVAGLDANSQDDDDDDDGDDDSFFYSQGDGDHEEETTQPHTEELINAHLVDPEAERQKYMDDARDQARDEIMAQAPEAELMDPAKLRRRRRRLLQLAFLVVVVVGVGASLAGVYGTRRASASRVASTLGPTISPAPTEQPSFAPSAAPTMFHDECVFARAVGSLPFFGSGRTDLAQEVGDNSPATACSLISGFDRAVWYQIVGTGTCVSATAAGTNFDTILAVYHGSSCEELICVTEESASNFLSSEATWTAQAGQDYFILVAGASSTAGDFTLTVSDVGSSCNSVCEDAAIVNTLPFSFSGNTETAPVVDPASGVTSCFLDIINPNTAGVWFEIVGTGSCISASTAGSELNTAIALYEGDCTNLTCVTASDDVDPEFSSEILFLAERDRRYRLLVGNPTFGGRGNFSLTISEYSTGCGNHGFICNYAFVTEQQACIYPWDGQVPLNTTQSHVLALCNDAPFAEPTPDNCQCFVGVGPLANIGLQTLCSACAFLPQANTTDGNWQIAFDCSNILSGQCVGLTEDGECIANEESNGLAPRYTCRNATVIDQLPFTETGTTESLHLLEVDFDAFACPTILSYRFAGWYTLSGSGSCFRSNTQGSQFDTVLSVYRGTCGDVTCIAENDDVFLSLSSQVEWFGRAGETYNFLLSSVDTTASGEYNLKIEEFDCTNNEACYDARLVNELPFADFSSTVDAPTVNGGSQALSCSLVTEGTKGVWFIGRTIADACVTISTVGSRFDTILAVYKGNCNDLTCVIENDDSSSLVRSSEVTWTAERGVLYYVFVGGAEGATGDYSLMATFQPDDFCA